MEGVEITLLWSWSSPVAMTLWQGKIETNCPSEAQDRASKWLKGWRVSLQAAAGMGGGKQWGWWGSSRRSLLGKTTGMLRKTGTFLAHSYCRDLHNIPARLDVRLISPEDCYFHFF